MNTLEAPTRFIAAEPLTARFTALVGVPLVEAGDDLRYTLRQTRDFVTCNLSGKRRDNYGSFRPRAATPMDEDWRLRIIEEGRAGDIQFVIRARPRRKSL